VTKTLVSLFSGIGGFELGFARAGYTPLLFCEIDPAAKAVLSAAWPDVTLVDDVQLLPELPACDVITAGFPCQDLSQAGRKAGIFGERSNLVSHLFRLLRDMTFEPEWVVVENVPFMLSLDGGTAMDFVLSQFEELGFAWAYRVVDARAFGLPQRRPRVILVASRKNDPRMALATEALPPLVDEKPIIVRKGSAYGFYWTEGTRGLGWVRDGLPPIKGGSGLGIPSAPAIWFPALNILGTPTIEDAERLQGFPSGWTATALADGRKAGARWKLVGNAVNVRVAEWLAKQLDLDHKAPAPATADLAAGRWPNSAYGANGGRGRLDLNLFPQREPMQPIMTFLDADPKPLSYRAAAGFLRRAETTPKLVYSPQFLDFLRAYCLATGDDASLKTALAS